MPTMTVEKAARTLMVLPRTVMRYVHEGKLTFVDSEHTLFDAQEVKALRQKRRQEQRAALTELLEIDAQYEVE